MGVGERAVGQPSLIGGTFAVSGGGGNELQEAAAEQMAALVAGRAYLEIPLNGGSDTRKAAREFWEERCRAGGISFKGCGFMVWIGEAARE